MSTEVMHIHIQVSPIEKVRWTAASAITERSRSQLIRESVNRDADQILERYGAEDLGYGNAGRG